MNTKNPNTERFAAGLRNLMDREQLTCEMLSEWAGVSRTAVLNWKSGRAYPQPGLLKKLEETLRMTAEEIAQVKPATKPEEPEPVCRSAKTDACYNRWFSAGTQVLMARHGMKSAGLARLVGVKDGTVISWIRNERSPKLASGLQIAEIFRTTVEEIVRLGQEAEEKCR